MTRRPLTLLLALFAALILGVAPAQAGQVRLHSHLDAYSGTNNCHTAVWGDLGGNRCSATEEHSAHQHGLGVGAHVDVDRCDPGAAQPGYCDRFFSRGHVGSMTLPHGYSRWMLFDAGPHHWLLAAVKMPNGPFAIQAGNWNGHHLKPSDPNAAVESHHGPLFLYVGYHGIKEARGGGTRIYGYVFGFRGYLNW